MHTYIDMCIHIHMHMCIYIYMCMYICMHIHIYVCMYINVESCHMNEIFSRPIFGVTGTPFTQVKPCLKFWGLPRIRVWYVRGLIWNLVANLAVVIIWSLVSSVWLTFEWLTHTNNTSNESCHAHECIMSHTWIHHVTHMNALWLHHICLHMWVIWWVTFEWFKYTNNTFNESCHTYECIMSRTWIHHVTHMKASYLSQYVSHLRQETTSHVPRNSESWFTYQWVMVHASMSHIAHVSHECIVSVSICESSETGDYKSCPPHQWVMVHVSMSHIAHVSHRVMPVHMTHSWVTHTHE